MVYWVYGNQPDVVPTEKVVYWVFGNKPGCHSYNESCVLGIWKLTRVSFLQWKLVVIDLLPSLYTLDVLSYLCGYSLISRVPSIFPPVWLLLSKYFSCLFCICISLCTPLASVRAYDIYSLCFHEMRHILRVSTSQVHQIDFLTGLFIVQISAPVSTVARIYHLIILIFNVFSLFL